MNAVPLLFSFLIAVANSRIATTTYPSTEERCEQGTPNWYCANEVLARFCDAEAFCEEYRRMSPCKKGPEVYCKPMEIARSCDKEAFCLTRHDDSITAVKFEQPKPKSLPSYDLFHRGSRNRSKSQ